MNPRRLRPLTLLSSPFRRPLSTQPPLHRSPFPPLPLPDPSTFTESFLKGSGPGGQKINKTASAVQLVHQPSGLVVKCQATRSRAQNRKIARRLLAERLEAAEKGPESRVEVRAERERGRAASRVKKSRRKYRALEAGKEGGAVPAAGGEDAEGEADEGDWEDEGEIGVDAERDETSSSDAASWTKEMSSLTPTGPVKKGRRSWREKAVPETSQAGAGNG